MRLPSLLRRRPPQYRDRTTPGQGGRFWSILVGTAGAIFGGALVAEVLFKPTKRNMELLAGIIFLGFVIVAHPIRAYLFSICLIPFPARTTVGTTSTLLIIAVAGLTMVKTRQYNLPSPFFHRTADLAIMGWALMLLLSFYSMGSKYYGEAVFHITGFASAVMLYYITIQLVDSEETILRVLRVSMTVAMILAVLAILQSLFPTRKFLPEFFSFSKRIATMGEVRRGMVRPSATFSGYELFAEYMALCTIFLYLLIRRSRTLFAKTFWGVGVVLVVMALFTTATRSAPIVLAGGLIYMVMVGERGIPRPQQLRVLAVVMLAFYLSLAFLGPFTKLMFERLSSLGASDSSVGSRTEVAHAALEAIARKPLLGHGPFIPAGTFATAVSRNVHNLYIHTAYTIGLPGLAAWVWFAVVLVRTSLRQARDLSLAPHTREIGVILHVTLVMFLVDQLKIEYTRGAMTMHLAWMHFGLIMALERILRRRAAAGEAAAGT